MSSVESSSQEHELCVRHFCYPKYLGTVNKLLTLEQRHCIEGTPFGWFTVLSNEVRISRILLRELCRRWVEKRGGFVFGCVFVSFTLLDVCVALGLRVYGLDVDIECENVDSECRSLFGGGIVKVSMVYDQLVRCEGDGRPEDFCKLYILLGLSEFLFPNRMGNVYPCLFQLVDNLVELSSFNWGAVVYTYLVKSLCKAFWSIQIEQSSIVCVARCVFML